MKFIQKNWLTLILGLAVLYFLFKDGCSKPEKKEDKIEKTSDTTKNVTVEPIQHVPKSKPKAVKNTVPDSIPLELIPSSDSTVFKQQYFDLLKNHLTEHFYSDSLTLRDASGKRIGVFNYGDRVKENEIKDRQPSYQINKEVVTITNNTTITKYEEPVRQLYIGAEFTGRQEIPLNGVNLGIVYKDRKDRIYQVKGGLVNLGDRVTWQAGVGRYWKVNLRKK